MKKLLVLMLAVLMCLTLVVTVACDPKQPPEPTKVELDITKGWKGNEEEETYTISDANGLTISYEKSGMWQYCRRVFLNETAEQLQKVKTLVMVGKMQADTYKVTLKFEYNEDLPAQEVTFRMSDTEATYEWDVSQLQLDKAARILLFAEGDRTAGNGTITLSKMVLTEDAINAANDVTKQPEPEGPKVVVNEITAENHSFNANWYCADGTFKAVTADGKTTVTKMAGGGWATLKADVTGAGLATAKSIKAQLSGVLGDVVIFKIEGNGIAKEVKIEPASTEDTATLALDLSDIELDATKVYNILFFLNWDAAEETGFVIESAEFSDEAVTPGPVGPTHPVNNITAENGKVANWYDEGAGMFTIVEKDGRAEVSKSGGGWTQLKVDFSGEGLATRKYFRISLSGIQDDDIIVKFDPANVEAKLEPSTEDSAVLVLDLSGYTFDATTIYNILIFFQFDDNAPASDFVIESAEFVEEVETPEPVDPVDYVNDITAQNGKIINWYDDGAGMFTVVEKDGRAEVSKSGGGWTQLKVNFSGEGLATRKIFRISLSGIQDDDIIVKFGPANVEAKLEPSTQDATVLELDLSGYTFDAATTYDIMIFFQFDDNAPASDFVIESAEFVSAPLNNITSDNLAVSGWYDNGDGNFTLEDADGKVSVTKKANGSWSSIKLDVTGAGLLTNRHFKINLSGIQGDVAIVKLEGNGVAKEVKLEASAEDTAELTLDLTGLELDASKVYNILIFFNMDATEETSFVIESAQFVAADTPAPVEPKDYINEITAANGKVINWYDGGDGKFTVVEKDGRAEVTKVGGGNWAQLKLNVSGEGLAARKYFRISLSGMLGDVVIVKLEGNGVGKEVKVEPAFTVDAAVLNLDLSDLTLDATKVYNILIFFNWDAAEDTSFVIESAEFTSAPLNTITAENGAVSGWYDGGDGKYTVTVADGKATVTKVGGGSWAQLKLDVTGAGLLTNRLFKINLSGIQGDVVIVKLEGNGVSKEAKIEPASTEDMAELVLDLSDLELDASKVYNILIFFNWDAAEETSFVIESAEFVVD